MADAENAISGSKKRVAGRQISKENPELDDDDTSEPEMMGTFQRASEEVLATRRILKVRRQTTVSTIASSNPFAAIRLVSSTEPNAKADDDAQDHQIPTCKSFKDDGTAKNEEPNGTEDNEKALEHNLSTKEPQLSSYQDEVDPQACEEGKKEAPGAASTFSSFKQLSSGQNAFTSLVGTGFGSSSFSFGSVKEGSDLSSFSFASSGNGGPSLQEVPVETGEENENSVFTADATLYEYFDGSWKERGRGEIRVNSSISGEKTRLVMRTRGNYRLILNASLYPDMTLTNMEKKGVTFSCINMAGGLSEGLTTCALKFKDSSFVEDFCGAVMEHKGRKAITEKTAEQCSSSEEAIDV